jgi:hypothetical protein
MMKKMQLIIWVTGACSMLSYASSILNVSADATIKKATPTVNYGGATDVSSTRAGTTNKVYLAFDASSLGGSIIDITSMTAYSIASTFRGSTVYLITNSTYDVAWNQSTITYNNAPGNALNGVGLVAGAGIVIGSFATPTAANQTIAFTFTSDAEKTLLINALNTGARKATLVSYVSSTSGSFQYAALESTLDGAHPAQMTVIPEPATCGLR